MLGLSIGLYVWTQNIGTSNLALVWSIIFLIILVIFLVGAYFGSKDKHRIEAELIKKAVKEEEEKAKHTRYDEDQ